MKYSLWFMPEGEAFEGLSALISELSDKYHAPLFEPHITLLGGLTLPLASLAEKSRELSLALKPFTVELDGVGYLSEYYKCLFIKVKETEDIMRANERAKEVFERREDPSFAPHVSIMYGNLKESRKRKIITSIEEDITRISFKVGSLLVYSAEGGPSDWYRVKEFSLR